MKNKLLLTTALISTLSLVGGAQSEITIGGSIEQTFASTSTKTASSGTKGLNSQRSLGNETNLNITGGQKLSNGMSVDLKANFEFDATVGKEVSMQITSGDAFFVIANDFTQGLNSIQTPKVGEHPSTIAGRSGATSYTDGYVEQNDKQHAALGFKVAGGNIVAIYSPNNVRDLGDAGDISAVSTGSGYELTYLGSPVANLTIGLGMAEKKGANTTITKDIEAKKFMASYKAGKANIGVEYSDRDNNTTSDQTGANGSVESMAYGVTYNVSDTLSVGLAFVNTKDEDRGNTNPDEEIKLITLGYNWNGLGLELSYADTENQNNVRSADNEVFQARTVVKF